MLYATNTGSAPVREMVCTAAATSRRMLEFQLPIHFAVGCEAIRSSAAASAGRERRSCSADCRALELGSTYSRDLPKGLSWLCASNATGAHTPAASATVRMARRIVKLSFKLSTDMAAYLHRISLATGF